MSLNSLAIAVGLSLIAAAAGMWVWWPQPAHREPADPEPVGTALHSPAHHAAPTRPWHLRLRLVPTFRHGAHTATGPAPTAPEQPDEAEAGEPAREDGADEQWSVELRRMRDTLDAPLDNEERGWWASWRDVDEVIEAKAAEVGRHVDDAIAAFHPGYEPHHEAPVPVDELDAAVAYHGTNWMTETTEMDVVDGELVS